MQIKAIFSKIKVCCGHAGANVCACRHKWFQGDWVQQVSTQIHASKCHTAATTTGATLTTQHKNNNYYNLDGQDGAVDTMLLTGEDNGPVHA